MSLSNKNRTVVKDGRLQVKKKRTDRSYLQPESAPPSEPVEETLPVSEASAGVESAEVTEQDVAVGAIPEPPAAAAVAPQAEAPVAPAAASPPPPAPTPAVPVTGAARALQQQGVRKRREVDLNELARRDSSYAMHELRRIAILTVIVVITLVVLAVVLR